MTARLNPSMRDGFARVADLLAAVVAASIPWSTSATSILVVMWLIAVIPSLDVTDLRDVLRRPAAWLVVALVAMAVIGTLWSVVPWPERVRGLGSFAKLLLIVLLFAQYRRSNRALWVFGAFLASCTALLTLSFGSIIFGDGTLRGYGKTYGVPVKDYIAQSGEFILCAAGLLYVAAARGSEKCFGWAVAALLLACVFLINVFYISPSRTGLVTVPLLLVLFAVTQLRWRHSLAMIGGVIALAAAVWMTSSTVRDRMTGIAGEVRTYKADNTRTSAGERIEFWKKSAEIVGTSPVIGHGTGSIQAMFARLASGTGTSALATANAHNQTLNIAIQLGIVGALLLIAMWVSHLALFRGGGLVAWLGLAVVAQNIIGGLFNNHLFDFVQGWIYIFGVGICGGVMLKRTAAVSASDFSPSTSPARP